MAAAASSSSSSQVPIYVGAGADVFCVSTMKTQLKAILDDRYHRISEITSFWPGEWIGSDPRSIAALVVPGGSSAAMGFNACISMGDKTQVDMDDKTLNANMEACGKKLRELLIPLYGSCAGAIMAASRFKETSEKNQVFPQVEAPNFSFFPGLVLAPLFRFERNKEGPISSDDFNIRKIRVMETGDALSCAHIFGPGFIDVKGIPGADVISVLEELQPTWDLVSDKGEFRWTSIDPSRIADGVFYKAKEGAPMVLTGAHLEIDSHSVLTKEFRDAMGITLEKQKELAAKLQPDDEKRQAAMKSHLKRLGLRCKP